MKISIYTAVRNGIENDFHVEAMLRHHAPLVDEIVVNEGYSSDGTYERIQNISKNIVIFRTHWGSAEDINWYVRFKEEARKRCTGDWCILLDCDEFIPEWEFEKLRAALSHTNEMMLSADFINFYGNYRVFHGAPGIVNWPARKMIVHRNDPQLEIWGDGSNVKIRQHDFAWGVARPIITVHHFGMVRDPGTLRYKWWTQGRRFRGRVGLLRPPRVLFNMFPHDWMDAQFFENLVLYDGPLIAAVREQPAEFVRDKMLLVRELERRRL
jgi:glycosyltransferase involved in cell wall biosynthesis